MSFLAFEGLLVLELCLEVWVCRLTPLLRLFPLSFRFLRDAIKRTCPLLQDLAGDAFFFHTVFQFKHKEWVRAMLIPYSMLFAAACCVSLLAGLVKLRLFVAKWRSRESSAGRGQRSRSLGGVQISPHLSGHIAVGELKERFDAHRLERYKYYGYLLAAVIQDVPMGTAASDDAVAMPAALASPSLSCAICGQGQ